MAAVELYSTPLFSDTNLLGYWRLEGNSNDSKGNVDGSDTSVTYGTGTGKFGEGATFGSSSWINFGNTYAFEYDNPFSVSFWYKGTFSGDGAIIGRANKDDPYNGWFIEFAYGAEIYFCLANSFTGTTHRIQVNFDNTAFNDGAWCHIAFTYDGSGAASGIKGYYNGESQTIDVLGDNLDSNSIVADSTFQFNGREGAVYTCTGTIDDVAIFGDVLTATEISNLYNGTWATTSTSSTSSSSSTSTSTTLSPVSGGVAWGEENPDVSEIAVSWQTYSDGGGGIPTITGDSDWGKISLDISEEGRSKVYDFGNSNSRTYTITENKYGTGQESATIQIRGHVDTVFTQDSDEPPNWANYTTPVTQSWRYVQARVVNS